MNATKTVSAFWLPTIPYTVIDAINRMAAATGSVSYAMASAHADYNGHFVRVYFNQYRGYWLAEYTWSGRNVLARGDLARCLAAAKQEYKRGALGCCVEANYPDEKRISTDHNPEESPEGFAAECKLQGFTSMAELTEKDHSATWVTPMHELVNDAMSLQKHGLAPAVAFLANSSTVEEYRAKLEAHYAKVNEAIAQRNAAEPPAFIGPELPPAVHKFEEAGLGKAPFRFVRYESKTYQACPGVPIQPGTTCDYCGTGISGVYWIKSTDGREFKVGCDCVMKTGDAGLKRIVNSKKASLAKERKAIRETEKRAAQQKRILAENPGLESALSVNHRIIKDIASRFTTWGSISSAQIALVMKLAKEASTPKPEEIKVAAPAGRQCFSGVVVSLKEQPGFRGEGTVEKIVVKVATPDGIWLAWGTCPHAVRANIGDTIELTGTLTRSDRDAHFAFFKRPTNAKIVSRKEGRVEA